MDVLSRCTQKRFMHVYACWCDDLTRQLNKQLSRRHVILGSTLNILKTNSSLRKSLPVSCFSVFSPAAFLKRTVFHPNCRATAESVRGIHGGAGMEQHLDDIHVVSLCRHVQRLAASGGLQGKDSCDGVFAEVMHVEQMATSGERMNYWRFHTVANNL